MLPSTAELLATAERGARAGARELLAAFGGAQQAQQKTHRRDLVTAADTASERAILAILASASGEIGLLSEEAGLTRAGARALWIVDPLDGTANFARGYPVFSISIACVAPDGPLCGLILDPLRDELYEAARGEGARLGGRPLRVSETSELAGAFVSTGFPYYPSEDRRRMADVLAAIASEAQDLRRGGSAALDLAYVAAGRAEAHIELNLAPHDVAAGVLLIEEAGGSVQALSASPDRWPRGLIASNGLALHAAVRDPVAAAFALQPALLSFASLFT